MAKRKLLRITTVPQSLHLLLNGQFSFMQANGYEVCTASADGREVESIKKTGAQHVVIPFTRKLTPLQDLVCLFLLIKLMHRFHPDIVHTHTPKAGLLGMIAAWLCRVPTRLHTVAGLPFTESRGLRRGILRIAERVTYSFATRVYPNSYRMMQYILDEFSIAASHVKVIGNGSSNGIDTNHFRVTPEVLQAARKIREENKIADNEVLFCFVGRIVRDKGIVELSDAFRKLQERYPCRLMLVGPFESDLDPLPVKTVEFLKTNPRIILPGFQDDVRPWIVAADIFVFPSYREGFPNVVMQAGALEVPIVATNINGCNELIADGETGLLVPAKDAESLGKAMESLLTDGARRKLFGARSRLLIQEKFDQHYFWNELLTEYKRF